MLCVGTPECGQKVFVDCLILQQSESIWCGLSGLSVGRQAMLVSNISPQINPTLRKGREGGGI